MVTIEKETVSTNIFQNNQKTIKDIEFVLPNNYQFHHNPKTIKYIMRNRKIIDIINELSFIKKYDESSYEMLVVLCEYFFKIYYNILSDNYDCGQYCNSLYDIRKELLNNLAQLYFAIPQFSKGENGNLWEKIDVNRRKLQAITYRCLKIVSHYGKKSNVIFDYKGPKPSDTSDNKHILF
jgi:hypothetical protein